VTKLSSFAPYRIVGVGSISCRGNKTLISLQPEVTSALFSYTHYKMCVRFDFSIEFKNTC